MQQLVLFFPDGWSGILQLYMIGFFMLYSPVCSYGEWSLYLMWMWIFLYSDQCWYFLIMVGIEYKWYLMAVILFIILFKVKTLVWFKSHLLQFSVLNLVEFSIMFIPLVWFLIAMVFGQIRVVGQQLYLILCSTICCDMSSGS